MFDLPDIKNVQFEYNLHPKAEIVDIYKLIFQGHFGAGHFIIDPEKAEKMLQQELETATTFETDFSQQISKNYFRVNIKVVTENIVKFDDFLKAFLQSTKTPPQTNSWISFWKKISHEFSTAFNWEKTALQNFNKKLSERNFIFHHSDVYRNTYQPHYRLISIHEFKKLKLTGRL